LLKIDYLANFHDINMANTPSSLELAVPYVDISIEINNLSYVITEKEYQESEYLKTLVDNFRLLDDEGKTLNISLDKCVHDKEILNYLFSLTNEINLEYIYFYYTYANYLSLRQKDLDVYLDQYVNSVVVYNDDYDYGYHSYKSVNFHTITCTSSVFTSLLRLYEINRKLFNLNKLFDNTSNLKDIYQELKQEETYLSKQIFNDYFLQFEMVLKDNSNNFDKNLLLFELFQETTIYKQKFVSTLLEFKQRFNDLTFHLLENVDWTNIIVAGGMPLEAYSRDRLNVNSDLDLFIYGDEEERILNKQLKYFNDVAIKLDKKIYFAYYFNIIILCIEDVKLIIQIIVTDKQSKYEIIDNFDMSHTVILYDGDNVYCKQSFLESIKSNKSKVNPTRLMKSSRIQKAIQKGFEVTDLYKKETEEYDGYLKSEVKDEIFYPLSSLSEEENIKELTNIYKNSIFVTDYHNIPLYPKQKDNNPYNFVKTNIKITNDDIIFQPTKIEEVYDRLFKYIQRIPIVDKQQQHYIFKTEYLLGNELYHNYKDDNNYLLGSLLIKDEVTKRKYIQYLNLVLDKLESKTEFISLYPKCLTTRNDWKDRILKRLERYDMKIKQHVKGNRFFVQITSKTKLFYKHQPITYLELRELLDNVVLNYGKPSTIQRILPNKFRIQTVFSSPKIIIRGDDICVPRNCQSISIIDR
jgi:hypothetical protein